MNLVSPTTAFRASFLAAVAEYQREDMYTAVDAEMSEDAFARYVESVVADKLPGSPRPDGHVPQTHLWWVDGDEFLGRLSVRHSLTDALLHWGGNIGYDVRPSARRQGHATAMLRAGLPVAAELGIEQALVTCADTNVASRRVIEACGGTLWQGRDGILRFWVPTAP